MFIANKVLVTNKIGGIEDGDKLIKKYKKLLKTRKLLKSRKLSKSKNLKDKKLSKFQKLIKSKKKLSKSRNLPNFDIKKNKLNFLISNTKIAFNCL